jgi:hypothetical protein
MGEGNIAMKSWDSLGSVAADALIEARLELHWAAQAAAAPGKQLLPQQPDYGQQSFAWDGAAGALAQGTVAGPSPFRSALRPSPPALLLLSPHGEVLAELALAGHTLDDAFDWLTREAEAHLGRSLGQPLERPAEMPPHAVGSGAPFAAAEPAAFAELAALFALADTALRQAICGELEASAVRCWPHHFDLATLVMLEPGEGPAADPESARSIGLGLSPGDGGRALPYFYVTPWPYPKGQTLPPHGGGGNWNLAGWVGAVLEYPRILATATGEARQQQVDAFLASALAACRTLLGG